MVLIGYWPLNETSGTTAYDRSGQNNHGTLNGGVTQGANGITGSNAYQFDPSNNEHVRINNQLDILSSGQDLVTFSAWITVRGSSVYRPFGSYDGSTPFYHLNHALKGGSGSVGIGIRDDNGNALNGYTPNGLVDDGEWHHIVGVKTDSSNLRMYVDGRAQPMSYDAKQTHQTSVSCPAPAIGAQWNGSNPADYHDGRIAEVRVYNHALTKQEIQYLYQVAQRGRLRTGKRK